MALGVLHVGWSISLDIEPRFANVLTGTSNHVLLMSLFAQELELELVQSHMAQKPVLRGEAGCACVAREVRSVSREEVWASAGVQGAWVGEAYFFSAS